MPSIGAVPEVAKETTVQSLNRIINERIQTLEGALNRLETFADRMEPQPHPTADQGQKTPPVAMDLQGMNHRLATMGERLDWLLQICNRLERIA